MILSLVHMYVSITLHQTILNVTMLTKAPFVSVKLAWHHIMQVTNFDFLYTISQP